MKGSTPNASLFLPGFILACTKRIVKHSSNLCRASCACTTERSYLCCPLGDRHTQCRLYRKCSGRRTVAGMGCCKRALVLFLRQANVDNILGRRTSICTFVGSCCAFKCAKICASESSSVVSLCRQSPREVWYCEKTMVLFGLLILISLALSETSHHVFPSKSARTL